MKNQSILIYVHRVAQLSNGQVNECGLMFVDIKHKKWKLNFSLAAIYIGWFVVKKLIVIDDVWDGRIRLAIEILCRWIKGIDIRHSRRHYGRHITNGLWRGSSFFIFLFKRISTAMLYYYLAFIISKPFAFVLLIFKWRGNKIMLGKRDKSKWKAI